MADTDWQALPSDGWQPLPPQEMTVPTSPLPRGRYGNPVIDDPSQSAGFWANAKASLFPADQDQVTAFADSRNINPKRYGVIGGHIVYLDDNGNFVRETPSVSGATGPLDAFNRVGQWIASQLRPVADQAAGTVAGVATAPFLGGIPGAAGAATATDAALQYGGRLTSGEGLMDAARNVDYGNAAGQGALAAGGQAVGGLLSLGARALYDTNPLRAAGFDAGKLTDSANRAAWQAAAASADRQGITLTPGELTGAKSLLVNQRQLGRMDNAGAGATSPMDILGDMYARRNNAEVPAAVSNFAQTVSPNSGVVGHVNFQQGAKGVLDNIVASAQKAGSPSYEAAFRSGIRPDVAPVLDHVTEAMKSWPATSEQGKILARVQRMLQDELPVLDANGQPMVKPTMHGSQPMMQLVPQGDLRVLHGAKMALDVMPNIDPVIGADSVLSGQLEGIANGLRDTLVAASPDYAAGNAAYVKNLGPLDSLKAGPVGKIANGQATINTLLSRGNSLDIATARKAFVDNGQEQAWNDGVRAYIEDGLDRAQTMRKGGDVTNVAGGVNVALAPTPRVAANLSAALGDPGRSGQLNDLLGTLQRASRAPAEGSPTATDIGKDGRNLAGFGAKTLNALLNGLEFWEIPDKLRAYVMTRSGAANAAKLAERMTQPNAFSALEGMRMLPPQAGAYARGVSGLLGEAGYLGARGSGLLAPDDRMPPVLSGMP